MYAKIFKQNYQFQTTTIQSQQPHSQQSQANQLIGLLTTIDNLKPEYKVKYAENFVKKIVVPENKPKPYECPLDLSVKITSADDTSGDTIITPPITPQQLLKLSSPLKKRYRNDENFNVKIESDESPKIVAAETTPKKPIKPTPTPNIKTSKQSTKSRKDTTVATKKQHKAVRKLKFDEHKSSPVSGTIIRSLDEIDESMIEKCGDIDPQYNIVEVTDEAKAELAQITNVIGAYICKLCRIVFEDAFGLARHRCSCIVLLEYRCPECGKRFNCPANLASHRRWHKPRDQLNNNNSTAATNKSGEVSAAAAEQFKCGECGKFFKRQAYLRKHQATHRKTEEFSAESNDSNISSNVTNIIDNNNVNYSTKMIFHIEPTQPSVSSNSDNTEDDDDDDDDSASDSSDLRIMHPHKKFRLMSDTLTEDENIAAAALAYLRNGASVIKHTQALSV